MYIFFLSLKLLWKTDSKGKSWHCTLITMENLLHSRSFLLHKISRIEHLCHTLPSTTGLLNANTITLWKRVWLFSLMLVSLKSTRPTLYPQRCTSSTDSSCQISPMVILSALVSNRTKLSEALILWMSMLSMDFTVQVEKVQSKVKALCLLGILSHTECIYMSWCWVISRLYIKRCWVL